MTKSKNQETKDTQRIRRSSADDAQNIIIQKQKTIFDLFAAYNLTKLNSLGDFFHTELYNSTAPYQLNNVRDVTSDSQILRPADILPYSLVPYWISGIVNFLSQFGIQEQIANPNVPANVTNGIRTSLEFLKNDFITTVRTLPNIGVYYSPLSARADGYQNILSFAENLRLSFNHSSILYTNVFQDIESLFAQLADGVNQYQAAVNASTLDISNTIEGGRRRRATNILNNLATQASATQTANAQAQANFDALSKLTKEHNLAKLTLGKANQDYTTALNSLSKTTVGSADYATAKVRVDQLNTVFQAAKATVNTKQIALSNTKAQMNLQVATVSNKIGIITKSTPSLTSTIGNTAAHVVSGMVNKASTALKSLQSPEGIIKANNFAAGVQTLSSVPTLVDNIYFAAHGGNEQLDPKISNAISGAITCLQGAAQILVALATFPEGMVGLIGGGSQFINGIMQAAGVPVPPSQQDKILDKVNQISGQINNLTNHIDDVVGQLSEQIRQGNRAISEQIQSLSLHIDEQFGNTNNIILATYNSTVELFNSTQNLIVNGFDSLSTMLIQGNQVLFQQLMDQSLHLSNINDALYSIEGQISKLSEDVFALFNAQNTQRYQDQVTTVISYFTNLNRQIPTTISNDAIHALNAILSLGNVYARSPQMTGDLSISGPPLLELLTATRLQKPFSNIQLITKIMQQYFTNFGNRLSVNYPTIGSYLLNNNNRNAMLRGAGLAKPFVSTYADTVTQACVPVNYASYYRGFDGGVCNNPSIDCDSRFVNLPIWDQAAQDYMTFHAMVSAYNATYVDRCDIQSLIISGEMFLGLVIAMKTSPDLFTNLINNYEVAYNNTISTITLLIQSSVAGTAIASSLQPFFNQLTDAKNAISLALSFAFGNELNLDQMANKMLNSLWSGDEANTVLNNGANAVQLKQSLNTSFFPIFLNQPFPVIRKFREYMVNATARGLNQFSKDQLDPGYSDVVQRLTQLRYYRDYVFPKGIPVSLMNTTAVYNAYQNTPNQYIPPVHSSRRRSADSAILIDKAQLDARLFDLNIVNSDGNSALMMGVSNCDISLVQEFLNTGGVNLDLVNKAGNSPLDLAIIHCTGDVKYTMLNLLLNAGAKVCNYNAAVRNLDFSRISPNITLPYESLPCFLQIPNTAQTTTTASIGSTSATLTSVNLAPTNSMSTSNNNPSMTDIMIIVGASIAGSISIVLLGMLYLHRKRQEAVVLPLAGHTMQLQPMAALAAGSVVTLASNVGSAHAQIKLEAEEIFYDSVEYPISSNINTSTALTNVSKTTIGRANQTDNAIQEWSCTQTAHDELTCTNPTLSNQMRLVTRLSGASECDTWFDCLDDIYECQTIEKDGISIDHCVGQKTEYIQRKMDLKRAQNNEVFPILAQAASTGFIMGALPEAIGDTLEKSGVLSSERAQQVKLAVNAAMILAAGSWLASGASIVTTSALKGLGISDSKSRVGGSTVAFFVNTGMNVTPTAITATVVNHVAARFGIWAEKRAMNALFSNEQKHIQPSFTR